MKAREIITLKRLLRQATEALQQAFTMASLLPMSRFIPQAPTSEPMIL